MENEQNRDLESQNIQNTMVSNIYPGVDPTVNPQSSNLQNHMFILPHQDSNLFMERNPAFPQNFAFFLNPGLPSGMNLPDQRLDPDDQVNPNYLDEDEENNNPDEGSVDDNNSNSAYNRGRWTKEEHERFIEALQMYGKEWKKVQQHVRTRSSTQARSHAQKFFVKMQKNGIPAADYLNRAQDIPRKKRETNRTITPVPDYSTPELQAYNAASPGIMNPPSILNVNNPPVNSSSSKGNSSEIFKISKPSELNESAGAPQPEPQKIVSKGTSIEEPSPIVIPLTQPSPKPTPISPMGGKKRNNPFKDGPKIQTKQKKTNKNAITAATQTPNCLGDDEECNEENLLLEEEGGNTSSNEKYQLPANPQITQSQAMNYQYGGYPNVSQNMAAYYPYSVFMGPYSGSDSYGQVGVKNPKIQVKHKIDKISISNGDLNINVLPAKKEKKPNNKIQIYTTEGPHGSMVLPYGADYRGNNDDMKLNRSLSEDAIGLKKKSQRKLFPYENNYDKINQNAEKDPVGNIIPDSEQYDNFEQSNHELLPGECEFNADQNSDAGNQQLYFGDNFLSNEKADTLLEMSSPTFFKYRSYSAVPTDPNFRAFNPFPIPQNMSLPMTPLDNLNCVGPVSMGQVNTSHPNTTTSGQYKNIPAAFLTQPEGYYNYKS